MARTERRDSDGGYSVIDDGDRMIFVDRMGEVRVMDDLEKDALALIRQYGFFMPAGVKALLLKVADRLGWSEVKKSL
jgi:hypothetical protein